MDDWFRFVVGTIVAGLTTLAGWFAHVLFVYNDKISRVDVRLSVLEHQPHVDPLDYVKAVTEMSAAIANLTQTITMLRSEIQNLERVISKRDGRNL